MVPPPPDLTAFIDTLEGEVRAIAQRTAQLEASPLPSTQLQTALMEGEVAELDRQRRLWTARTPQQEAAITRFTAVLDAVREALNTALRLAHDRQQRARAATGYQGMQESWRDANTGALNHPVAHLPLFAELLEGQLEDARSLRVTLEEGMTKPHVLDDDTLDRVLATYHDDGAEHAETHRWQLRQWSTQPLSDEQHLEVTRLTSLLDAYQREARAILELERQLRQGSIDRILERSDAELGLDALLRMIGKKPR